MDELRRQVLSNTDGEEKVEVNQRHLIDKILARYSAEFVVFRELMQNADDAKSSSVQIIFETQKGNNAAEPNILKDKCVRVLFKNNGFEFRPEDWNRLKKIAEGNPDEQKIGAFGVGFYSLFSVCEEPFVSSGGQGMAFYWKGDQLFAKRAVINQTDQTWTTFLMDMREHSEFPNAEDFGRFLATSLGFTGNLREISVYFNDKRIIHISKKMSDPRPMNIIAGLNTASPQKMFTLKSVDVRQVQLDVERLIIQKKFMRSSKGGFADYPKEEASIYLRVASGHLDVRVSKAFSNEMERTTKKKPPTTTSIHIIFTGYDEHSYSSDRNEKISDIFKNLLPYPEQGRIFIGFPTHQTTGCSSHLAARLIPTVERESIDLVDRTLSVYNNEMLCLVGILCRILYEDEMAQISKLYKEVVGSSIDFEDEAIKSGREYFERKAAHALKHFTFRPSTPNAYVGRIAELQFYKCSTKPISILSTRGVQPADLVRLPNPEMKDFIKSVPVVPKIIMAQCDDFIKKAKDTMKLIKDIKIDDVFVEVQSRALSKEETIALMKWWITYKNKENPENDVRQLLHSTIVRLNDDVLLLDKIRYFLNPAVISPENEVPSDVLPYSISKGFNKADLEKYFGGWKELSLATWTQFIVSNPQLETNPDFAEKILGVIARSFGKCSNKDQELIKDSLSRKKCIPTKHGMKIPDEAYFPNVNLFPDLPIVHYKNAKAPEKLLQFLGVRKHVDLQLVFDRLVSQGNWDHMHLVKYLSSVASNLKDIEVKRLKVTAIWPKEQSVETQITNTEGGEVKPKVTRFMASELYVPSPEMRKFKLPVIEWNGKWHRNSEEAKFLLSLGLQEYPPLTTILQLASPDSEPNIRKEALKYFIDNFKDKYSSKYKAHEIKIPFLQCTDPNVFETPLGCFSNPECTIMKFHALHQDLRFRAEELGVRQHPPREQLLDRLVQHPLESETEAREVFGYLASQQASFISSDWNKLGNLQFIPIRDRAQPNRIVYASPRNCFFKSSEESFGEYFSYVDFGEKANMFLRSCGVKAEPSPTEFAEFLVRSSREFWNTIGDNVEKYLSILRNVAINSNSIYKNKALFNEMCRAPILLGMKRKENDKEFADSPQQEVDHYVLASAKDIYINDNTNYQQVFSPLTAPMEQTLEKFYQSLGSRSLYSCVKESIQPRGQAKTSRQSIELKKMIDQRAQLFYHDVHRSEIKKPVRWVQELRVMQIERIDATYILTTTNETKVEQIFSCIVEDSRNKSWILYVTPGEPDYLDIASNLGQNMFLKSKWKDISHLAMLLTTPLPSLKRKGYPVDRILASYKKPIRVADKYEPPKSSPQPAEKTSSPNSSPEIEKSVKQIQETYPDCDPAFIRQLLIKEKFDLNKVANNLADSDYPKTSKSPPYDFSDGLKTNGWNLLEKVKSYVSSPAGGSGQVHAQPQQAIESNSVVGESPPINKPIDVNPGNTKNLHYALREAVKSCRSNSGSVIDSRATVNVVTESQTSYCDILPGHSLNCIGVNNGIELYIAKGLDPSEITGGARSDSLTRFVNILRDLCEVFELQPKAIHIFYDNNTNSIAFNRGKALFFNFRFYLGLHDEEDSGVTSSETFTYWYMTFCHELAHNFIAPHNSEHEYYFSSFAETYMSRFLTKMKKLGII